MESHGDDRRKGFSRVCVLSLIGMALVGVALFAPDANPRAGAFFQAALETSWRRTLDFPAVWSSMKIILFCLGLFLTIESVGTVLAMLKCRALALWIFFLQVLPVLGLLCGSYYLVKAFL